MDLGADIIYVINLPKHTERKERMIDLFNTLNITNYEFIKAINGEYLPESDELVSDGTLNHVFVDPYGTLTKNIVGCALSHRLVYETFLKSDYETCLVFEDDVALSPEFYHYQISGKFDKLLTQIKSSNYDIIMWGKHELKNLGVTPTKHSELYKIELLGEKYSAHSYQLNRKSAQILYDKVLPIRHAADIFLESLDLNILSPKHSLYEQKRGISRSIEFDSMLYDLWKNNTPEVWRSSTSVDTNKRAQSTCIPPYIKVDKVVFKKFKPNISCLPYWSYIHLKK